MLKIVHEVDEKGYVIEKYVGEFKDGKLISNFEDKKIVTVDFPQPSPFFRPRWNSVEWVEGETEEERNERESLLSFELLKPTQQELDDAQLEIKVLTLLSELEMI